MKIGRLEIKWNSKEVVDPREIPIVTTLKILKKEDVGSKWKILAVKEVRNSLGCDIMTSKDLVERINHKHKIFKDEYYENRIMRGEV